MEWIPILNPRDIQAIYFYILYIRNYGRHPPTTDTLLVNSRGESLNLETSKYDHSNHFYRLTTSTNFRQFVSTVLVCFYCPCLFLLSVSVSTVCVCFYCLCLFLLSVSVSTVFVCFCCLCLFLRSVSVSTVRVCLYCLCLFLLSVSVSTVRVFLMSVSVSNVCVCFYCPCLFLISAL